MSFARLAFAALATAGAAGAFGGDFGVSPIRVELDRSVKSAVITVTNDDRRPLAFQVRALQWTQDAEGADRYAETADLVYFPRQLKLAPKESRVVRVGYRAPPAQREQAFRLYIEELADQSARDPAQTGVSVTLRFGVPIFLRPATPAAAGALELPSSGGRALIRNTGNVHFRVNAVRYAAVDAGGKSVAEQTADGWYLLAGVERAYPVKLPREACARGSRLRAEALVDKLELRAERALAPEDCR